MTRKQDFWPAGATWVFQGTVLEDATVGTHLSSLTVTPGAGNEMILLYGKFIAGNGAANLTQCFIDDGANLITSLIQSDLSLAANQAISFPFTGAQVANGPMNVVSPILVSGTMRFIIRTSTAT